MKSIFLSIRNIVFILFLIVSYFVSAQINVTDPLSSFQSYDLEQQRCLASFYEEANDENLYCIANYSRLLQHSDAKYWYYRLVQEYPFSSFLVHARKDLGFIYFSEKNYEKSSYFLGLVDQDNLKDNEYYFKLAYSLFAIDRLEDAQFYFMKVSRGKYRKLCIYYLSHILYSQSFYDKALENFKSLESHKDFGKIIPYYITQIYFIRNQYQDLVDYAPSILENVVPSRESEMNRLIAESYYQLGDYYNAEISFANYLNLTESISDIDYFQLGHIYLLLDKYDIAITYLEQINNVEDSLMQYASYYLGKSYLNLGNKKFALQSFKKASDVNFDMQIKEESLYNYFKLAYELDMPYTDYSYVLEELEKNNLSNYVTNVKRLMIDMFESTNQYQEAFDFLKDKHLPDREEQSLLQRLSFYLGVQHYNNAKYSDALLMFEYSQRYAYDHDIDLMSSYWIADCYFHQRNYQKSIDNYLRFITTPSRGLVSKMGIAQYNLAYAYFYNQDYASAANHFRKALKQYMDQERENDAKLRLADSYYMMKDFLKARTYYIQSKDLNVFDQDYALYQQSQCASLLSNLQEQEDALMHILDDFSSSPYYEKALIDLANLYKNKNKNDQALVYYNKVLSSAFDDESYALALLNKGLIYFNDLELEKSVACFKEIISDYARTSSFHEAKVGLRNAYVKIGDVQKYMSFINTIPSIDLSVASKDSLMYKIAYNTYKNKNYDKSRILFSDYFDTFNDNPIFRLPASYYLAESYLYTNDTSKSIELFSKVINYKKSEFLEPSLVFLARIFYDNQDFDLSNSYYTILDTISSNNELKRESVIRLMYGYEGVDLFQSSRYAERVLSIDKLDNILIARSKMIIARSDFDYGNYARSLALCNDVIDLTKNEDGTEAMYLKSYFLYLEDSFARAEEIIFQMADQYSSDHWIAKGFLLLSDIYVKLDNDYQAKAILESVIEHHDGVEIVNMAREKWENIVKLELSDNEMIEDHDIYIELSDSLDFQIDYEILDIDYE